ncbi:MAG: PorV/PorQ family protein [Longimicrobiales bacterium]
MTTTGSRSRTLCTALVVLSTLAVAQGSRAQEGGEPAPPAGAECCLHLLVPVGARASALGGAITARSGADAVFRNPAGLAALSGSRFVIHHSDDTTLDVQVDAFSLLFTPFSTTMGISYQLFDRGEIETTDPTGQPTGELSLRDHLLAASFALPVGGGVSAGVNYKVFQQRIDCRGICGGAENVATTQAVDVGLHYNPSWHPALEIGLAVVNAGLALQVINFEQSDRFPGRIHFGVVYDLLAAVPTDNLVALRLAVDARDKLSAPDSPTLAVGLELDVQQAVFLRAGYTPGEGLGTGAAVGLELRYDRFDIGVSRSFANSLLEADAEPFHVSLGLHF